MSESLSIVGEIKFAEPDVLPMRVTAPDGRTAFLQLKDGRLIRGGDLPTDEAAWIFMEALSEKWIELSYPKPEPTP